MDGEAWWDSPWGHKELDTTERLHYTCVCVCVCVCVCIFKVKSNMCPKLIKLLFYQKETLNGVN